jgi:hypothetical protein
MAVFEVFYQPGKLFASLPNRRGTWVVPIILSLLFSLAATYLVIQKIGLDTIVRQQIEARSNMTPEQQQQALNRANSPVIGAIVYGSVVLASLVLPLIIAGLLSIFALMAQQQPRFGTMFSMVVLAWFPYAVVSSLMGILVLFASPDPGTLDYQNLLSTNVGAFMNKETTGKALYAFLTSMDVLSFFEIGFLGYGFSRITRSSFFYGVFSVGSLWALYVAIKAGFASLQ